MQTGYSRRCYQGGNEIFMALNFSLGALRALTTSSKDSIIIRMTFKCNRNHFMSFLQNSLRRVRIKLESTDQECVTMVAQWMVLMAQYGVTVDVEHVISTGTLTTRLNFGHVTQKGQECQQWNGIVLEWNSSQLDSSLTK